jgi:hypothetical protein
VSTHLAYRGSVDDQTPTPQDPRTDEPDQPSTDPVGPATTSPVSDTEAQPDPSDSHDPQSPAAAGVPDDAAIPSAHPVLVYSLLRLAVLAAVGGLLWLLGLRGIYLILLAFLVSGVISAVALSRRREGAAYGITRAVRSANARIDASSRAEDVDDADEFDDPTTSTQSNPPAPGPPTA